MRVSTPGQKIRNLKSNLQPILKEDKIQPPDIPPYDPEYEMQYGCSRKTGCRVGGYFWNPPNFCEQRIVAYGNERWVLVSTCRDCFRYKSKTCSAADLPKIQYDEMGKPVYDEPATRKKSKRVVRA